MFQESINRNAQDVPGMRGMSRFLGPVVSFIGGYVNILLFIGVLCGEQPVHYQQTLLQRGAGEYPRCLTRFSIFIWQKKLAILLLPRTIWPSASNIRDAVRE